MLFMVLGRSLGETGGLHHTTSGSHERPDVLHIRELRDGENHVHQP